MDSTVVTTIEAPIVSAEEAERTSIARWNKRRALPKAFMDQHIPKYERETFNFIGLQTDASSVFEIGDCSPIIPTLAYGFTVAGFYCKPGEGPAMHQHVTEEVFIVTEGEITVYWVNGEDDRVEIKLEKYDMITVPIGLYRGFYNSGSVDAVVMAIGGGPDMGKIAWHPSVVQEAREAGLNVSDGGKLLD